eukprot:57245-Chlamydomonas_euryale.AAC.4
MYVAVSKVSERDACLCWNKQKPPLSLVVSSRPSQARERVEPLPVCANSLCKQRVLAGAPVSTPGACGCAPDGSRMPCRA